MFRDFVKEHNPKDMLDVDEFLAMRKEVLAELSKDGEKKASCSTTSWIYLEVLFDLHCNELIGKSLKDSFGAFFLDRMSLGWIMEST